MARSFHEIRLEHLEVVDGLSECSGSVQRVADHMVKTLQSGGTIFFMGNGGSAADSQHLAAEFVGRFQRERMALPSIALTTDTSVLTAIANDYGYDRVFERQLSALCRPGDVVVGISTSGNSPNVLRGLARANEMGAYTVGLTGAKKGAMEKECEECICVPSKSSARIQECHILIGHALCELVEEAEGWGQSAR